MILENIFYDYSVFSVFWGVRFSLYLVSWLSDFDKKNSVCVVFGPLVFSPRKWGGGQGPLAPPPWIRACFNITTYNIPVQVHNLFHIKLATVFI